MIREVKLLLEDDEKIAIVSSSFVAEFSDWEGPFDIRVSEDPYREGYVEVELKRASPLNRVTK